jgi:lipopolysaccharide transport system ATP-binding protein
MSKHDPVLRVDGVSKKFRKGEVYDSLRDLVPALTGRFLRARQSTQLSERDFWALRDISFEVARGEAFGIVGSNGAGKSTILKLLSGIMKPTVGSVQVAGRLSALIEVGAGFHPDLTGRENVYLNGSILGMRREEIRRKFDEIVAFSGLDGFIDTPVKRYSSGMYARLGFAVAAHVEPDLLIVDEVLSVGDYVFQRKCAEKMASVIRGGATVVFVSHNLRAVAELCSKSILLERGRLLQLGPTSHVIKTYLDRAYANRAAPTDSPVRIASVTARTARGEAVDVEPGERMTIDVRVEAVSRTERLSVVLMLTDSDSYEVFNTSTERLGHGSFTLEAGEHFDCSVDLDMHLPQGTFHLGVLVYRYDVQREYDRWMPAATLFVKSPVDVRGAANLYPQVRRHAVGAGSPTARMVASGDVCPVG